MVAYVWERTVFHVPEIDTADYGFFFKSGPTMNAGDEIVRLIMSYNVIDFTTYSSLSEYNNQPNLIIGVYWMPDPTTLTPQHPATDFTPDASAIPLYYSTITPWTYHEFTSPTDPADRLLYRTAGHIDIQCRTQHKIKSHGLGHVQVAVESVASLDVGHHPLEFTMNGTLSVLYRIH